MPDDTQTLMPASPGLVVRDPITRQPLAAAGEPKPLDTYWARRLRDGDVRVQQPAALPAVDAVGRMPQPSMPKPALKTL